jgi:hypothetical protein
MAWVESGILGGICWSYFLVLTARGVMRVASLRPNLAPLYSYLLVGFVWDILYSPFGSVNRIWAAYFILISYNLLNTSVPKTAWVPRQRVRLTYLKPQIQLPRSS